MRFHVSPMLLLLALALLLVSRDAPLTERLVLVGLLLGSVLVHEVGHALAARLGGLAVGGVYLHIVSFAAIGPGRPAPRFFAAVGGPLASLLLAGSAWLVLVVTNATPEEIDGFLHEPVPMLVLINLLMGTINLLPALPLDGGRAVEALCSAEGASRLTRVLPAYVGIATGLGVIALAIVMLGDTLRVLAIGFGAALALDNAWRLRRRGPADSASVEGESDARGGSGQA